ncbi:glycoside hydrolase family 2 protein [Streptomyces nitrosporeus]|uniref:beta-mannosidase n=1 Tax=Streptomyces nitrosporeus TaxID=28894 RepID=A0A5J6FDF6_9ACTN|nr:glycoside hydrolase family 2 protein [Streptomyces nitrosporeus]QEU74091.1 glycoside hydrolase family 2 protein [Streptomyces nitrosporeus]GGY99858.1 beta-mannosidase [Streptomyces nitrosporeus]
MTLRHLPLHDGWTLTADGPVPVGLPTGGVPAAVPGTVHTDLLAAGLIDDPYLDDNETRLGWIGRTDWTYRTTFEWAADAHEFTDLCFDGLDTVATVLLNGTELGSTANQHRSYRFPVRPLLREGENTLAVRFTAPYTYAEALREKLGDRPGAYTEPYAFIRKMACNFGWDWGPTLVTSGIWRPVALESWSGPRIAGAKVLADLDDDGVPRLTLTLDADRAGGGELAASVSVVGAGASAAFLLPAGEDRATVTLSVPGAEVWWPHSHGAQPLYDVVVRLGEDEVRTFRTGFRGVALEREAFRISVNGEPVFVRGMNWIPDDCFPSRLTRQRVSERLDQALAANVNLIRVWGGGLYESDDFYELCDEKGLLVWQDFPFACAAYPEEQPLYDEVAAEARENLVRLAPHPSLVLWCGNNENLEGHADWGWQEKLEGRTWGYGYYHGLLPAICAETDPTRPYWPGSPYSGSPDLPPQDPASGTVHLWEVWNRVDYRHYADTAHRFVAEFGFQGPPAYATLRRAVSGPLGLGAPLIAHHQKAEDGDAKLLRGLGDHLPQPAGFDDWHWLTQLNQARAVAFGIRHFRSHTPYCMGAIVWQLNDCWPVVSWSAVDGDGRRKPLWYALRQVYADRLMALRDGALHLVNDSSRAWRGTLVLARYGLDGTLLAETETEVSTAPRDVSRVPLPAALATPGDAAREVLVARLGELRTVEFYEEDTRLALPPARYDAEVTPLTHSDGTDTVYRVEITAHTLLRDLALFPDRLDPAAEVDDMLITLLPGESHVFHVRGAVLKDPEALGTAPVLRCVNDTVGR